MSDKTLTAKQMRFLDEYVKDFDVVKAFVRAGYAEATAGINAYRTFNLPHVQDALKARLRKREEAQEVNVRRIVTAVTRIAEDAERCGQFQPALKAYEMLGKYLGMFVDRNESKVLIKGNITNTEMADAEIARLLSVAGVEDRKFHDLDELEPEGEA